MMPEETRITRGSTRLEFVRLDLQDSIYMRLLSFVFHQLSYSCYTHLVTILLLIDTCHRSLNEMWENTSDMPKG